MISKYILFFVFSFILIIKCEITIKDPKKFISSVVIDTGGDFKYILMEMVNKTNPMDYKYLVRGCQDFYYHKKIYYDFMQKSVYKYPDIYMNFDFNVLGGGRISFLGNEIMVYGESGVYGRANHKLTCNLLKKFFVNYNIIDS